MRRTIIAGGTLLIAMPLLATSVTARPVPLARGEIVARAAISMVGTPYSWGGGGPDGPSYGIGRGAHTKGFDCSGLTEYAWAKVGLRIGPTTYTQWYSGMKVPRTRVRPGDLAFFETDAALPGPDHVGVVIDRYQMVAAPFTGAVVRIERLDRKDLIGIIRPGAMLWRSGKETAPDPVPREWGTRSGAVSDLR